MLFKREFLDGIAAGRISLAFRRWRRPTVRPGGALRTAIGVLAIGRVDIVSEGAITAVQARRAGYEKLDDLIDELHHRQEGSIYRIELRLAGPDPRIKLRNAGRISDKDFAVLQERLARFDQASRHGPWTAATLRLIARSPGKPAGDSAELLGLEKADLKVDVRKLKELGLTESLTPGYRLSARGRAVLKRFSAE